MAFLRGTLLLLIALLTASAVWGQGPLQVEDVELGGETLQFAAHPWQGRPAVSAFTRREIPQSAPQLVVHEVVLDETGWHEVGRWLLPDGTRYVEPMVLPGGASGWRLLVGTQWQIAQADGAKLALHPMCACDTIYSHGGAPDPDEQHFVYDLDGDGIDEVVLPYSSYLEAYRIVPQALAPEPLWRIRWHPDGTPLTRAKPAEHGFVLPDFSFPDVAGNGQRDLLVVERDRVLVAPLPAPTVSGGYGLDDGRRALLARRSQGTPLPASLSYALHRIGDRRFDTAAAFLAALAQSVPGTETSDWAPHLLGLLALARSELPVVQPYAVPITGLGTFADDDREMVLGRTDMDGDGVLDLLHAKLIHYGSVFSQQNELRWYRGHIEGGRLAFAPPTEALRSDAGSFAELVRPRREGTPPLALLMATTNVNLGSIMKALASQSVTLQARILPWQAGALAQAPQAANEFTYHELKASGRRAMFLFADLNGDGWRDYLLNLYADSLSVFLSTDGPPGLAKPSFVQRGLTLSSRPERVLIADLAGDGHEEIVLRYRKDYHPKLATKLRVIRYVAP